MMLILAIGLALLAGILAGTLTGLAPGIHINLVSALVVAFSAFFLENLSILPIVVVVFLVSMAMTHTFIDYIPSIFLGAPDEDDNALSILPGHEMLIKGEAYSAVIYTVYGGIAAVAIILLFSPIFMYALPAIYPYAQRIMPLILLITSGFLIYFERTSRMWAIIIFLLSGFLGVATLNLPIKEPLLPLFTGLVGISSLLTSIMKRQRIPQQKIKRLSSIKVRLPKFFKAVGASIIASPLCSFLPGLGSGQAAVIGSEVFGDLGRKEFLILLGAINTIVTGLSFVTLYTIGKARTGVAVAVGKITELEFKDMLIITGVIVVSGILAFFITIFLAKVFSKLISRINYRKLSIAIITILIIICFSFSGWFGLLIMAISAALGLTCIFAGIRRTHMMGCLILPAILFYLL